MENRLWHVTNVHSLCVDLAMSTKDEKAIKLVHSAKPVSNVLKVRCLLDQISLVFCECRRFSDLFGLCCCLLGSPRVEGDEEEDDIDDLDNEFEYGNNGIGFDQVSEGMSISRRNSGFPQSDLDSAPPGSQIPLLTYGDEVKISECIHIV